MIREELYGLSRETCSGVLSPFCRGGDQHSGSLDQLLTQRCCAACVETSLRPLAGLPDSYRTSRGKGRTRGRPAGQRHFR